jgi:hypothetical protein
MAAILIFKACGIWLEVGVLNFAKTWHAQSYGSRAGHSPLQARARLVERQSVPQHAALQLPRLVAARDNEAEITQPMQIRFK